MKQNDDYTLLEHPEIKQVNAFIANFPDIIFTASKPFSESIGTFIHQVTAEFGSESDEKEPSYKRAEALISEVTKIIAELKKFSLQRGICPII